MAFQNSKQHSYWGFEKLATYLGGAIGGWFGIIVGKFTAYFFNWLAKYQIYYINVGITKIETNMDKKTWEKVSSESWALKDQIDEGKLTLSDEEIKKHSGAFRSAFKKFAVYGRVSDSQTK